MEAFGQLVERHHGRALNFAHRIGADPEEARDIAQETFLRIFHAAARYETRGRFTTYLYTVVRNQVRDQQRRRTRHREAPLEDAEGLVGLGTASSDRPDAALERARITRRLWAAVAALPEDQRVAFVLSEIENLRYQEIAEICGCPEGTVASRKHKAIQSLRRQLHTEGDER